MRCEQHMGMLNAQLAGGYNTSSFAHEALEKLQAASR